jgi:hypothetical protein
MPEIYTSVAESSLNWDYSSSKSKLLLSKMPIFLDYDEFFHWKIMYKILLNLTVQRCISNIQSTFMGQITAVTSLTL